jgi:hypothetical protein
VPARFHILDHDVADEIGGGWSGLVFFRDRHAGATVADAPQERQIKERRFTNRRRR